jgi:hypothetical protein
LLNDNTIRSPDHGIALVGLLQLAKHSPGGYTATISHGSRNRWFDQNTASFFDQGGPFAGFRAMSAQTL